MQADGVLTGSMDYLAFGGVRAQSGSLPTTRRYTGQRVEEGLGFYDYNARQYDPYLNRFIQPDDIIPDPNDPLSYDRYAYARNSPTNFNDPSGHCVEIEEGFCLRDSENGGYHIVHSDDGRFANYAEEAIADAILSGDATSLNRIPKDTPAFMVGAATEGACQSLGVNCGMYYRFFISIWTMSTMGWAQAKYSGSLNNSTPASLQQDAMGDPDCSGCGFAKPWNDPTSEEILMPNGQPIGASKGDESIRTVQTEEELQRLFNGLIVNGIKIFDGRYSGQWYKLPGGGRVGWRISKGWGSTIDIDIPGIPFEKIHLP